MQLHFLSMKPLDYLLMRTPAPRLGAAEQANPPGAVDQANPGEISTFRILLSFVGLFIGIVLSFVVTGIQPAKTPSQRASLAAETTRAKTDRPIVAVADQSNPNVGVSGPGVNLDLSAHRIWTVGLISLVICLLTYQQLYFSLALYQKQPAFLIIFVAFQYGYFWPSIVQGAKIATG